MHRAGLSPLGLSGVHRFSYRVVGYRRVYGFGLQVEIR